MLRIVAALAVLAVAAPAQGQYLFRDMQALGLDRAEWRAMGAAAQKLYSPELAADGATAEWSTPSGARGVATLLSRAPRADGTLCIVIGHSVTPAKAAEAKALRSRRCRQADGSWAFSAN